MGARATEPDKGQTVTSLFFCQFSVLSLYSRLLKKPTSNEFIFLPASLTSNENELDEN